VPRLYSKWSHKTTSGILVPIPIGVSKSKVRSKKSPIRLTIHVDKKASTLVANEDNLTSQLIAACRQLLVQLEAGAVPGNFWQSNGLGVSEVYRPAIKAYVLNVRYPCLEKHVSRRREFYVGTENTKGAHYPTVFKVASEYRTERLNEYREWFKQQTLETIEALKGAINENQ